MGPMDFPNLVSRVEALFESITSLGSAVTAHNDAAESFISRIEGLERVVFGAAHAAAASVAAATDSQGAVDLNKIAPPEPAPAPVVTPAPVAVEPAPVTPVSALDPYAARAQEIAARVAGTVDAVAGAATQAVSAAEAAAGSIAQAVEAAAGATNSNGA